MPIAPPNSPLLDLMYNNGPVIGDTVSKSDMMDIQREQEARLAQKRLEEEKARLRYEQQQQIAKQEQNTAQLKVYFEAMNLGFHTDEEDFNASMSVLSIYH